MHDEDISIAGLLRLPLDVLPVENAIELLKLHDLTGSDAELATVAHYVGRHSLALMLAAEFLVTFHEGDVSCIREVQFVTASTRAGRHAMAVMEAYAAALERDGNRAAIELLETVGLFDRPAEWSCIERIREASVRTNNLPLHGIDVETLMEASTQLQTWGLISLANNRAIDAHPLVREYYGSRLMSQRPESWRCAHAELSRYFAEITGQVPSTEEEVALLLRGIAHACEAGLFDFALVDLFRHRVMVHQTTNEVVALAMQETLISCLSHFFDGKEISSRLRPGAGTLGADHKAYLYTQVGDLLSSTRGYSDARVAQMYSCAAQLDPHAIGPYRFKIAYGLWKHYSAKGDYAQALPLAESLLRCSERNAKAETIAPALRAIATTAYRLGRFNDAYAFADRGANARRVDSQASAISTEDCLTNCLCIKALALWHLGRGAESLQCRQTVLETTRHAAPHERAIAYYLIAYLFEFDDEAEPASAFAEEMLQFTSEYGFRWWAAAAMIHQGWAMSRVGDPQEGVPIMQKGILEWKKAQAGVGIPYWNSLLADSCMRIEQYSEAARFLEEAISISQATGEAWWEPELHRQRGLALMQQGIDEELAFRHFVHAAESARLMGSAALERRARSTLHTFQTRGCGPQGDAIAWARLFEEVPDGTLAIDGSERSGFSPNTIQRRES